MIKDYGKAPPLAAKQAQEIAFVFKVGEHGLTIVPVIHDVVAGSRGLLGRARAPGHGLSLT